jgi:nucleoid-associated protein YgaU
MPFERPTGPLTPAADAGAAANGTPDVQHGLGTALHGAEASAQAAAAKVSAEAAALSGKAMAAVGHAALAAIPGGEPISPMIQLIMKMPGAMGLVNNFFEVLHNLFSGENLIQLFNPEMFQHALGSQISMLQHLATGAEHFTVSLAGMPGDSLMNGFHNLGGNLMRLDTGGLNHIPTEHFTTDPANVGAAADMQTAQFEGGAGHISEGTVAGPAVTHGSQSNFLAGNQRLFSDRIGSGGGNFNSVTSNTNVPTTASTIPNNSGATFGQDAVSAPKIEGTPSGPAIGNEVLDKYGSNNVVSSDVGTYRPTTSAYWSPNSGTAGGGDAGSSFVEPMKAKQLSFQDMQSSVPTKSAVDHIGHQVKGIAGSNSSGHVMDGIGHQVLPKAFSTSSLPGAHHISGLNAPVAHHVTHTPVAHHSVAHHNLAKHVEQPVAQQQDMSQMQAGDQTQVAQATDGSAAPTDQPTSYTVQKGDSLWNIAEKQLGDGTKWTEIYKMNSDVIGQNPDLIFSGTELKLPGGMEQSIADAGKYVVKPGDNLWDIAKNQLGDGNKWGDLFKANEGVIGDNPRLILPGQELSMPGASNEALASATPAAGATAPAGMAQTMPTAQMAQMPVAQQPVGMEQAVAQQPMAQQMMQQQPIMQQQPMMQQAPVQNYGGAAYAGNENIQPAAQQVIQVQPRHEIPMGPGAAGASEIPVNPADAVVSSGLAPDLSWIKKQ